MNRLASCLVVTACLASLVSASVVNANAPEEVQQFVMENVQNEHHYGLYFSDREERLFTAITGLFSGDKEEDFLHMLVDSDKISLMKLNMNEEELEQIAKVQGIEEYPYIIVNFMGEGARVVQGPADEETALKILEELDRLEKLEVPEEEPEPEPVRQVEPAPQPQPQPQPEPQPEPQPV